MYCKYIFHNDQDIVIHHSNSCLTLPSSPELSVILPLPTSFCPQSSLMMSRSEIMKMDKTISVKERLLKQLEQIIARENYNFEEFLKRNEEIYMEYRTL